MQKIENIFLKNSTTKNVADKLAGDVLFKLIGEKVSIENAISTIQYVMIFTVNEIHSIDRLRKLFDRWTKIFILFYFS